MTLQDRAAAYAAAFPKFPPLRADERWIDGVWLLGNNYKGSGYYGAYPPGYLKRILALFPDVESANILQAFSGSLSTSAPGLRVDINADVKPDVIADCALLPFDDGRFNLVMADPPYGHEHAAKYHVPMINRRAVIREFARVLKPGGNLVWLDTQWPMYSKQQLHCWGLISVVRSTNHVVRLVSLFEKV